jgi:alcohol dehydrogenase class IV
VLGKSWPVAPRRPAAADGGDLGARLGITFCDTVVAVAQAISVRLDEEAARALRALESAGMSRSEAIRSALIQSARRLRRSSELAAEVAALEADDEDRDEMLAVAGLMEFLRAPR